MADRSLTIRVGANVSDLVSKFKVAEKAAKEWADKSLDYVNRNAGSITHMTNVVGGLGLALTGIAALAVSRFAEFDAAMSGVQASTMETAGNMDLLREAAIQAGAETVFSATEAAGAIENLAKAGVSTADILGGGLTGALDLAAAGELDVAAAAEIAATAMTQFGLSGEDVTHIADLLAAGAGKAQGDVTDMAAALNQSGLVASQFGLSIEETTGTLTAFAEAGLLGSDAGTSFRTMLLRLGNPSREAKTLMDQLGISAYDAQGNFVGMADLAGQLERALGPLPQVQRDAALATIFGSDAIRSANVLYTQGEQGIRDWITAVDDQGYAAEVAATRMDNLKGDLEGLSGSFETFLIRMGEGANGPLRNLVQALDTTVDKLGELPSPILQATGLLAGAGGLTALGVAGLGKLVVGIAETRTAMQQLGISARTAKLAVAGIGGALTIGVTAFTLWANAQAEAQARTEEFQATLDEVGNTTDATLEKINDALAKDNRSFTERLFGGNVHSLIDDAERYGLAIEDLQGFILGEADAVERVRAATEAYNREVSGHELRTRTEETNTFVGSLESLSGTLTEAERAQLQEAEAAREAGIATNDLMGATDGATSALQDYAAEQQTGTISTETYTDALKEMIDAQREAAGVVLSERDAQRQLQQSIADATAALEENGETLDITTEKGRRNQDALDGVAEAGWDVIDSMRENGATQAELQSSMETTRARFVGLAEDMGLSADEAAALADELGLIPEDVNVDVAVDTEAAQGAMNRFIRDNDGRRIRIYTDLSGNQTRVGGPGNQNAMASGGRVVGPGSGTSDSIPAWLSNGEYVIKAASVARYGDAMLAAINSGTFAPPGFADGGRVVAAPQVLSAPTITVAAPAGGGDFNAYITAADPRAALKELRAEFEMAFVGVSR